MWLPQRGCWHHLLFISSSPNNYPLRSLFFMVVLVSVELCFPFILVVVSVFISFIVLYPEIWCPMDIFATLVAHAFEELNIFHSFFSPEFIDRTFSSVLGFSCFLRLLNSVSQNQKISFLSALYEICEILTFQETLAGL